MDVFSYSRYFLVFTIYLLLQIKITDIIFCISNVSRNFRVFGSLWTWNINAERQNVSMRLSFLTI